MKKGLIAAAIIIAAAALIAVVSYHKLVRLEENADNAYSNTMIQLQRRSDLIPNLVNVIKVSAADETEVYTAAYDADKKLANSRGARDIDKADDELSKALGDLTALVRDYPELKSDEGFVSLRDELAGLENRINIAKSDYDRAAGEYNAKLKSFPSSLIARVAGFEEKDTFSEE